MATLIERIRNEVQKAPTSHGPSFVEVNPVLSLDEIAAAEDQLGFRLPALLRQLYLEIGNGGFGPGHGLLPLLPSGIIKEGRFVVNMYIQKQHSKKWYSSILPFASWGCGILSCIDLGVDDDPTVYRFEPNMPSEMTN